MAVPKFNEIMPDFVRCLGDGELHTIKEIRAYCADALKLTEEDRQKTLPSGSNMFNDRVGWARTYLKKAGLIESPSRAHFKLTKTGMDAFQKGPEFVTVEYLAQFESFQQFYGKPISAEIVEATSIDTSDSPIETIEQALSELNDQLSSDLMTEIMKMSAYEFEGLVVKLLVKMGYGNTQSVKNLVTKKSGDEGIDGIVSQDKLGFDSIYIQAKQWKLDSTVGRPEVQKFLGALAGQGAVKGLFITTARFSSEAIAYVNKQLNHKIVLVDGQMLTNLMIEYNLGVSINKTYEVKRIDTDFFNEDI